MFISWSQMYYTHAKLIASFCVPCTQAVCNLWGSLKRFHCTCVHCIDTVQKKEHKFVLHWVWHGTRLVTWNRNAQRIHGTLDGCKWGSSDVLKLPITITCLQSWYRHLSTGIVMVMSLSLHLREISVFVGNRRNPYWVKVCSTGARTGAGAGSLSVYDSFCPTP